MRYYKKYFNIKYFAIFLFSLWASLFIPPMQSPDENQHIARAYLLSQGEFLLKNIPEKMSGGYIDNGLYKFIELSMSISGSPEKKFTPELKKELEYIRWDTLNKKTFLEIPGTGFYLPLIYIPHALAFKLGEVADLSIFDTYRITSFFLIAISLLSLCYAFSIYRPSAASLSLILLPMSVFQLLSPTLDGFTTSLCFVIFSIFLKIHVKNDNSYHFYILTILVILIATTRIHLTPIVLLLFIVSLRIKNKIFFFTSFSSTFLIFSWIIFAIKNTVDNRVPREMNSVEIIFHYLSNPIDYVKIIYATISNPNMLHFYGESFIGKIGWLDTPLEHSHYIILYLGLVVLFLISIKTPCHEMNNRTARISFLFIAIASILAIFTALLVSWTPFSAEVIHGVQGRYFIIPLILLSYCLHGLSPTSFRLLFISNHIAFYLFSAFSIYALLYALNSRYYFA